VQRPSLYFHHGIYVSDDRVIQFGSGVNLVNKRGVGINAVLLQDFEQGGTARVVRHGYESWFSGWHPPADESWKIVERAEFLLKLEPRLPYNLVGQLREIIANMCVTVEDAAHHLGLPRTTLQAWTHRQAGPAPLVHRIVDPDAPRAASLLFVAVVEAHMLRGFRDPGLSAQGLPHQRRAHLCRAGQLLRR
jgi:hypothetical protein